MSRYARDERQAAVDTLERVGPSAPTLCAPWTTRELAAHLALRERRLDAAAGIALPVSPLAAHTERVQRAYARRPWGELVDLVRHGPPGWWPTRVRAVDEAVNTMEMFIHHEDVLRATGWTQQRRELSVGMERALWEGLTRIGRLLFRRAPTGVVLVADGFGRTAVKRPGADGTVVLSGRPGELALYAFGPARVAEVVADGSPDDVARLAAARLGV